VLELGCGYGRILSQLAEKTNNIWGIDSSLSSLLYTKKYIGKPPPFNLFNMNANSLGFCDNTFDIVLCLQNGLSAFKENQQHLIAEAVRVTKPGGFVLLSSYSEKFWLERLKWFQVQSDNGLIGEIDYDATKDGIIVCKDGFKATTISQNDFLKLTKKLNYVTNIFEVDDSSIFFEIKVKKRDWYLVNFFCCNNLCVFRNNWRY
jgi:2-polyprenyl-6-hydroxyphenyl methylase/3-demethylubiquinone-9 3-methyltransferase